MLQLQSGPLKEDRTTISIDQIIAQAVSMEFRRKILFLKLLKDISSWLISAAMRSRYLKPGLQ